MCGATCDLIQIHIRFCVYFLKFHSYFNTAISKAEAYFQMKSNVNAFYCVYVQLLVIIDSIAEKC